MAEEKAKVKRKRSSSRSSGAHCSVHGCSNNNARLNIIKDSTCLTHNNMTRRICGCDLPYRLHQWPKDPNIRRLWLDALRREKPPKTIVVCSFHFIDRKPTAANPVPTLYLGYENMVDKKRNEKVQGQQNRKLPTLPESDVTPAKQISSVAVLRETPSCHIISAQDILKVDEDLDESDSEPDNTMPTAVVQKQRVFIRSSTSVEQRPPKAMIRLQSQQKRKLPTLPESDVTPAKHISSVAVLRETPSCHIISAQDILKVDEDLDESDSEPDNTMPTVVVTITMPTAVVTNIMPTAVVTNTMPAAVVTDTHDEASTSSSAMPKSKPDCVDQGCQWTDETVESHTYCKKLLLIVPRVKKTFRDREVQCRLCEDEPVTQRTIHNDADAKLYVGVSKETFLAIVERMVPFAQNHWRLPVADQILMTLMTSKLKLLQGDVARRFCVSESLVSKTSSYWIKILGEYLPSLLTGLPRETATQLAYLTGLKPSCRNRHAKTEQPEVKGTAINDLQMA